MTSTLERDQKLWRPALAQERDASTCRADLAATFAEAVLILRALRANGQRVERQLAALKERSVKLALDDFGTGYASLAYLQRLPVDIVKIDRSFTAKIDSGQEDLALLRGIVGLGKALGLQLVAEGIERVRATRNRARPRLPRSAGLLFRATCPGR